MHSDRRTTRRLARAGAAALVAVASASALVACSLVAGLGDYHEVDCDDVHILCSQTDTGPLPDVAPNETSPGDDGGEPDVVLIDAGPLSPHRVWAHWPMPNPADAGFPHPARYDDGGAATVTDLVTGLEWERSPNKFDVFNEAARYCAQATIGGKSGWRLPTRIELVSIINTTRKDPAMESPPFQKGAAAASTQRTWSASPVSGAANTYWTVDFLTGTVGRDQVATNKAVARCVRGGAP